MPLANSGLSSISVSRLLHPGAAHGLKPQSGSRKKLLRNAELLRCEWTGWKRACLYCFDMQSIVEG